MWNIFGRWTDECSYGTKYVGTFVDKSLADKVCAQLNTLTEAQKQDRYLSRYILFIVYPAIVFENPNIIVETVLDKSFPRWK